MNLDKFYRIHTGIGSDAPMVLNVPIQQTFNNLEILSLKLKQINDYSYYESSYGIIVGRVLANDAFGIPNAKVSVFIPVEDGESLYNKGIYPYTSIRSRDNKGIRYNLLPDNQIDSCYQNVGTFPNKRLVLDNNDTIDIFDKYWRYTTTTNEAGDYMIFGVPKGEQQIHVDVDLSDIGVLSQRPRDMIYKGYNINLFESPNKFKQSTNLDSLSQIYSQNKGVYVYSYWGDTTDTSDTIAITRCDIQLEYKFEPTCIFLGSIITDTGSNSIGKSCASTEGCGRMENLSAGEGSIEMIRKTLDGKVEEVQIKGNRLIDGNGVWCYQIPMNLDYVKTDEFGNIVPTDDPNKGIPTRARVRFRISLDESPNDSESRKRCKYLIPNNPRIDADNFPIFTKTKEVDYEFGSLTREESYKDLLWNNVYTVKNYIPRLQKNSFETNRKHSGIKAINYYGDNNPFPYNNVNIKLSFTYRLICVLTKIIIYLIGILNVVISTLGYIPCWLSKLCIKIFKWKICIFGFLKNIIPKCIELSSEFCDDGVNKKTYYPGCYGCVWDLSKEEHVKENKKLPKEDQTAAVADKITDIKNSTLITCIENSLAQENDCVNFNFDNDWINGCIYAPLWQRKLTPKKTFFFGLFRRAAKDEWCSSERQFANLRIWQFCALERVNSNSDKYRSFNTANNESKDIIPKKVDKPECSNNCHKSKQDQEVNYGVILTRKNSQGQTIYYYKAIEYIQGLNNNKGDVVLLFATDIVLLGSLNDCDRNGIPQFFKNIESTTYKLPEPILFTDNEVTNEMDENNNPVSEFTSHTEMTGRDWGNLNNTDECHKPDGGLFYGIGCSSIELKPKSCLNLSRICEYGVSLDETKYVENLTNENDNDYSSNLLIPDGFISYDELYNIDERSMFATLNSNNLKTKINKTNGLYEYDLRFLYPENFDGSLYTQMYDSQHTSCDKTYRYNYNLETFSRDYYIFRMGDKPFYYDVKGRFPRYENSFYFYFGLKSGKTAIDVFNSQFFSNCENSASETIAVNIETESNTWCNDYKDNWDGYIKIDLTGISTPYSVELLNTSTNTSYIINDINSEKIYFKKDSSTDETFSGFTYIQQDEDNNNISLTNGKYSLIITDVDGNITNNEISFESKYLNFSLYAENFLEDNNSLNDKFGSSCEISSINIDDVVLKYLSDENNTIDKTNPFDISKSRIIGGIIGVYDIYYNNKPAYKYLGFSIEVESTDTSVPYGVKIDIDSNGNIISNTNTVCKNKSVFKYDGLIYNGDNQYFIFGIPKGDVTYRVTLTQFCDDDPTNTVGNQIYQDILVKSPTPYRMYIGDINYDIIKKYFTNTGWTITGDTDDYKIERKGTISDAWLHITDKQYYDWSQEDIYTIEYYNKNGYEGYNSPEEAVEAAKDEFITLMKNTFYITCPNDKKSITIQAITDDYPVYNKIIYKEETISDDDENMNVLLSCSSAITDNSTISDIGVPTITNIDNVNYGNEKGKITDDICFGYDNTAKERLSCNEENSFKHPYFVAIVNGRGNTKPINVAKNGVKTNGTDEDKTYTLEGKVTDYFGFHIIDKSFMYNMMAWSYIDNIPYFFDVNSNDSRIGSAINMNGLLTGIIYNGASDSETEMAKFSTQTFNGTDLLIETYTMYNGKPNEDAIPTKRVIVGKQPLFKEYPNYNGVTGGINTINNLHYASVTKTEARVTLEDSNGCQIEETVYGMMKLSLSSDSINDCKDNNSILKVYASNGDGNETYYIIKVSNEHPYILNNIYNNNGQYYFNCNNYDEYDYFRYEINDTSIKNIIDTQAKSKIPSDEDPNTMVESKGYGTNGEFTNIPKSPFYIIAITENNCRCISPVYDFNTVLAQIVLVKQTTEIEGSENETEQQPSEGEETTPDGETEDEKEPITTTSKVTSYKFGIKISNVNELYYFKNYSYSAEISCTAISDNNIAGNTTNDAGSNGVVYFDITENIYSKLLLMAMITTEKRQLLKKTNVIAKDYTSLRHNALISDVIISREVEIDKDGNEKSTEKEI